MCKLDYLIQIAFNVQPFQLSGGPRWIHEDRFDIEAKPPRTSKSGNANPSSPKLPPNPEQREMLQSLLADRFQLMSHRETKEGAVYLLVKRDKDLKLQDAKDKNAYPWVGGLRGGGISGDGLWGMNASTEELASRLSPYLDHTVLDRTGLQGSFDFKVAYASDDPHPDVVTSILSSIEELGLKLEPGRGLVTTVVIDRAEKPTVN